MTIPANIAHHDIQTPSGDSPLTLVQSRSSDWVLSSSQQTGIRHIGSVYDPKSHIQKWIGHQDIRDESHVVVIGFSSPYLLRSLTEKPIKKILVLHPNLDTVIPFTAQEEFDTIWSDPLIDLIVGDAHFCIEKITSYLNSVCNDIYLGQYKVLLDPNCQFLAPDFFSQVYQATLKVINLNLFSLVSDMKVGENETKNLFANLEIYARSPGIQALTGTCRGKPVVVIAAGPSASEQIDALAQFKQKPTIIAVDTIVPLLLKRGIEPTLIVSCDQTAKNYDHLKDIVETISHIPLVTLPISCPDIVHHFSDHCFMVQHGHGLLNYGSGYLGKKGTIPIPPINVGFLGIDVALVIEASPIFLIGFDFAYLSNQAYASGLTAKKITYHDLGGTSVFVKESQDGSKSASRVIVVNDHGKTVYTSDVFQSYVEFMKRYDSLMEPHQMFNLSSEGLELPGVPRAPFSQLVDTLDGHTEWTPPQPSDLRHPLKKLGPFKKRLLKKLTELDLKVARGETLLESLRQHPSPDAVPKLNQIVSFVQSHELEPLLTKILRKECYILTKMSGQSLSLSEKLDRISIFFESVRQATQFYMDHLKV